MSKIPIFFDFGGTIVDNIEIVRESFKQVFGKDYTSEQIKQMYKDMAKKRTSMYLFFKWPINPIKLLFKQKKMKKMQKELFLSHVKLFPGAKETLEKLKKLGNLQLVIVSQNPQLADNDYTEKLMTNLFDGEHPFDLILSGQDKLDLITKNFDTEEIAKSVFIGDLRNDIYIAEILKIPGVGVSWGYSNISELGTPHIADDFDDLYDIIEDHLDFIIEDRTGSLETEYEEIEFDESDYEMEFEDDDLDDDFDDDLD